jgi:hypothetical protein
VRKLNIGTKSSKEFNVCNWLIEKIAHKTIAGFASLTEQFLTFLDKDNFENWKQLETAKTSFSVSTSKKSDYHYPVKCVTKWIVF